jgi:hypothetical protein
MRLIWWYEGAFSRRLLSSIDFLTLFYTLLPSSVPSVRFNPSGEGPTDDFLQRYTSPSSPYSPYVSVKRFDEAREAKGSCLESMREWTDPEYAKEVGVPITTKSDLVRLLLLKKYGGVWLDGALRFFSSLLCLTSRNGRSSADDLLALLYLCPIPRYSRYGSASRPRSSRSYRSYRSLRSCAYRLLPLASKPYLPSFFPFFSPIFSVIPPLLPSPFLRPPPILHYFTNLLLPLFLPRVLRSSSLPHPALQHDTAINVRPSTLPDLPLLR